MDRFFAVALLAVQLALWTGNGEGNTQSVFFSLLFPQLMPQYEHAPSGEDWPFRLFEHDAGEATLL
ncbi:MAG: hypothetical protein Q4G52_11525 [Clostridia bacterium]|nr:hypothetical protein [Clostridia bacterium]